MASNSTQSEQAALADEQLLQLYLGGQESAFAKLIERYQQELLNFLHRFTGNRSLAEDVFQETFVQVHLSAGTFDPSRRFKPWLFTIAANKARDQLRRRARRPAAPIDSPISGDNDGRTFVDLMQADLPLPEENLQQTELQEQVQRMIEQLPEHLREILLLAYFEQLSYKDIAEVLQIPLGTVKSRLHTAVGTFAKAWKHQNPPADET